MELTRLADEALRSQPGCETAAVPTVRALPNVREGRNWEIPNVIVGDSLISDERVIVTPHIAALTDVTYRAMCVRTAGNLLAVLRGEQPEPKSIYRAYQNGANADV